MSSISSAISTDHSDIVQYYKNILDSHDIKTTTHWYNNFTWALSRHLTAEELVLYPAINDALGKKGCIIVEKNKLECEAIQIKLENLRSVKVSSTEFVSALQCLINDVAEHFNEVEMADIPALDGVLSPEESTRISESYTRVKILHPWNYHTIFSNALLLIPLSSWFTAPVNYLRNIHRKSSDGTLVEKDTTKADSVD